MAEAEAKEELGLTSLKEKSDDCEAETSVLQQQQKSDNEDEELECAVCLQKCVHPVRLPCSHIFCFLCVKGVANQSKRCAMCRQEIPADFLDHPTLLSSIEAEKEEVLPGGYQWFYEGRNADIIFVRLTEPVPTIASASCSKLTGVEPVVVFCCCSPST
nr:E3 ubiquitin-protein ligase rnf8-B-like [Cherax quadricarinatus]